MTWTAIAYNFGKRVKPIWESNSLNFMQSTTDMSVPETENPILVMDMGGVLRNRPDPFPFPDNRSRVVIGVIPSMECMGYRCPGYGHPRRYGWRVVLQDDCGCS